MRQHAARAYTPRGAPRKEAKPLDSGAKVEVFLDNVVYRSGVTCWRLPGVRGTRTCGTGMIPDGAGYLPELTGLIPIHVPQIDGRNPYNFLLSYKGQKRSGSAKQKIDKEIRDLGHWSDVDRVVAAVVIRTSVLTAGELECLRALGEEHLVAVLTHEEVTDGRLPDMLVDVAKKRRRLYKRLGPRGGYHPTKRCDPAEYAYMGRARLRRRIAAVSA